MNKYNKTPIILLAVIAFLSIYALMSSKNAEANSSHMPIVVSTTETPTTTPIPTVLPTPIPTSTPTNITPKTTPKAEKQYIVCITRTGSKYHRPSCGSLHHGNVTNVTLQEALRRGYVACKICHP